MIDPSQAPAGQPAPAQPGAPVVCIAPQGDGSFAVYPEGTEPTAPAPDIEQALEQARQILTGGQAAAGTGAEAGSNMEAEAEALFNGSFAAARTRN